MKHTKSNIFLSLFALFAVTLVSAANTTLDDKAPLNRKDTSKHGEFSVGEYLDDSVITTKVKTAIFNDETLKLAEISVETYKGTVQLSGFVKRQADIDKAQMVTQSIKGVTAVKNNLQLKTK
jgi:osmotically-inducible protein OsmY